MKKLMKIISWSAIFSVFAIFFGITVCSVVFAQQSPVKITYQNPTVMYYRDINFGDADNDGKSEILASYANIDGGSSLDIIKVDSQFNYEITTVSTLTNESSESTAAAVSSGVKMS